MKIAVISDIHGNIPALSAVLEDIAKWQPDEVIINGDVVNRGPYSRAGLELLQGQLPGAHYLTGNHETFVLHCAGEMLEADHPKYDLRRFAQWTVRQLGPEALRAIEQWPDHFDMDGLEGGSSFHITHGSRLGNREGISARTSEDDLPAKLGDYRELFVCSHTHKAMRREFNGTLIVNTGSVGQPLDGDPRASYGRFSFSKGRWQGELRRVAYDKAQAERDFHDSGFMEAGGPLAQLIFLEHRHNRMFVGPMMRRYHDAILAGEISVADAVAQHLANL